MDKGQCAFCSNMYRKGRVRNFKPPRRVGEDSVGVSESWKSNGSGFGGVGDLHVEVGEKCEKHKQSGGGLTKVKHLQHVAKRSFQKAPNGLESRPGLSFGCPSRVGLGVQNPDASGPHYTENASEKLENDETAVMDGIAASQDASEELFVSQNSYSDALVGSSEAYSQGKLSPPPAGLLSSNLIKVSKARISAEEKSRPKLTARPGAKRLKLDIKRPESTGTTLHSSQTRKVPVQWRKRSTKKNKSWEGDGILLVLDSELVLKADTKGNGTLRVLGRTTNTNLSGVLSIGQFEAEVDDDGDIGLAKSSNSSNEVETTPLPPTAFKSPAMAKGPRPVSGESLILHEGNEKKIEVDPALARYLRPHQREGVLFIYRGLMELLVKGQRGVLLADEMGLGKTLMTITVLWTLLKQSISPTRNLDAQKVLICCPVTLIDNWRKEFAKWLNLNRIGVLALNGKNQSSAKDKQDIIGFAKTNVYQVLIIGYEKLLLCAKELSMVNFDVLVCDEGHRLKNNSSKVIKLLDSLGVQMRLLLTGTPIQNDLTEFYTIASFINPGILGSASEFQKRFARPILRARDVNCLSKDVLREGRRASNELIDITKSFTLRRTQEVISTFLTKKTDILLFCPPTKLQKSLFKTVLESSNFNSIINSDPKDVLALIMVYRKICNSPSLLAKDAFFGTLLGSNARKEVDPASLVQRTTGSKINVLVPLLLEFQKLGEKTVLVSNFTQTLDFLATVLLKLNIQFFRLDGSTAGNARDKLVVDFQKSNGFKVFLLLAKAGGVGLNLVSASRLIVFDNDWNPSVDIQAMARIHRDGQKKPVFIYRLFTTGCIDEKIFQRQLMKGTLSDMFLDDKSESSLNIFDFEDLKDLFNVNDTNCNTHDLIDCPCSGIGESFESSQKLSTQDTDTDEDELLSLGWMSALELQRIQPEENAKKNSIRSALSHYKHFNPVKCSPDADFGDGVVNKVLQKFKGDSLLTYVFTHVTEGYL